MKQLFFDLFYEFPTILIYFKEGGRFEKEVAKYQPRGVYLHAIGG